MLAAFQRSAANPLEGPEIDDEALEFGPGPTAAWQAFRKVMPLKADPSANAAGPGAIGITTLTFLKNNPAWSFFPLTEPTP